MDNRVKTFILLAGLTVLMVAIGRALGGTGGMQIALVLAVAMNFFSYWYSDKIVLRMSRAQEVSPADAPELHRIVEELSRAADIPKPRVYVMQTDNPNAFATGRNPEHGAVAVTTGILRLLDATELKGVLGHEIGHIKNRDILIQSVASTLGAAITYLGYIGMFGGFGGDDDEGLGSLGAILVMILAPIAAMLIQMAISRSREYIADETGARLTHNPESLARALEKLAHGVERAPMRANPATEPLYIVNPLTGGGIQSWFSTHPPIEERVARLRAMRSY
ncbi:MAG: zinc metalloprotease HtpX [Syntrophobacterales bacterium]